MNNNVIDITDMLEVKRLYHLLFQAMESGDVDRAEELALQVSELTKMEVDLVM